MLKKSDKVKFLLKCAEKYGFDISLTKILTKKGNVRQDATWYDYEIGKIEFTAIGKFQYNSPLLFSCDDNKLRFSILAGSHIRLPMVCHLDNLEKPSYFVCENSFDWKEFDSEEKIEYIVKTCADKIEQIKLIEKQYKTAKRENSLAKDF